MTSNCLNPLSLNSSSISANSFVSENLSDFLKGKTVLASQQLINTLKSNPEIERLYKLPAGVTEGYTIEEHTLRVLEALEKDFNTPEVKSLLEQTGLSRELFALFLALHDIGKGEAYKEIKVASPLRKDKELQYCREIIQKIAKKIGLDKRIILIYETLLIDDNIGEFLKSNYVTKGFAIKTAEELKTAADSCSLSLDQFTHLKILFHKIDASSYPTLQNLFKKNENYSLVYADLLQNKINVLEKTIGSVSQPCLETSTTLQTITKVSITDKLASLTLGQFLEKDPYTFSIDEVVLLDEVRKDLKTSNPSYYKTFSNRVTWIKECKLPFRIIATLKASQQYWWFSDEQRFWSYINCPSNKKKNELNKIKDVIVKEARDIENNLKILEKLTLFHGTSSATLAMMQISDEWVLKCSGNILATKKAPMRGEFSLGGLLINGVNNNKISVETVRDIPKALSYSQNKYDGFNTDEIVKALQYPNDTYYQDLCEKLFKLDGDHLEDFYPTLFSWRKSDATSFWEVFDEKKRKELRNRLEGERQKVRSGCDQQSIVNCIIDDEAFKRRHYYYRFCNILCPDYDLKFDVTDVAITPDWENERSKWKYHIDDFLAKRSLRVTGIKLLQLLQWDEDLYKAKINTDYLKERAKIVEQKELDQVDDLEEKQKIMQWYQAFYDILDMKAPSIVIPKGSETRELFTKPFPVILASSSYRPTPFWDQSDFTVAEPIAFGVHGIDVIFTDTNENREKIKKMLPEKLKGEMQIHLQNEIDYKKLPLIHARHQIRI